MPDEYDDDSFNYQEEEDEVDALGTMPDVGSGSFSREDLINAKLLRGSSYKAVGIELIKDLTAMQELKQSLARWVHAYLSDDTVLADNSVRKKGMFKTIDPVDYLRLKAKLDLNVACLSATKFDTMQSWYGDIQEQLLYVFDCYVSRSIGKDRERLINSKLATETTMRQVNETRPTAEESKKKRKWF